LNNLYTIKCEVTSVYIDRGSRFVGYLVPLISVENFKSALKAKREKYKDSSHICSAYRVFNDKILEEKSSDDGEPAGSSGLPMLNELKRKKLVNVGVFVIRYFGGKKLGISGLVHAYSESVNRCISSSRVIKWYFSTKCLAIHTYANTKKIDFLIKKYEGELLNREFNLLVESKIKINDDILLNFKKEINSSRLLETVISEIK
tara:strand:+ start:3713 stop:4321 length:609 start_codon:yes stop_codon:yes gene_type:complete